MPDLCRLTLKRGKFVKAHILPQALTRPDVRGQPYIQAGEASFPVRRWTSWYDPSLVTNEGEEILRQYDDWGVSELRKKSLVWSAWGANATHLLTSDHTFIDDRMGLRKISEIDGRKLRLFFLSLLWRAAATSLPEFSYVKLSRKQLGQLRRMLVDEDPGDSGLFSIVLMQFSTKGPWHNHTPLYGTKDLEGEKVNFLRFYLDGLAVHIHLNPQDNGNMAVGASNKLVVLTMPFEHSFQDKNLRIGIVETNILWPEAIKKLTP